MLVVVGAGEADVGAHALPAVRGRACVMCVGDGRGCAAGGRWGRAMASRAGVAALRLAIDGAATKRRLACGTPCAVPRALFVDAVAASVDATYRCAVSWRRSTDGARGDELALIWSGPLPRAKCSGAGRDGRRSWWRGRADAPRRLGGVQTTTCKLRGGPRPWTPAAGPRRPPSSSAAALPRAVLFCEVSEAKSEASPCP